MAGASLLAPSFPFVTSTSGSVHLALPSASRKECRQYGKSKVRVLCSHAPSKDAGSSFFLLQVPHQLRSLSQFARSSRP